MKKWFRKKWAQFKAWVLAILVSLGLLAGAIVTAATVTYTPATEYEDGTSLPLSEIAETKLYCSGGLLTSELGADGEFEGAIALLPVGDNSCYSTHVATNGLESSASNTTVIRVVPQVPPKPPVLD